MILEKLKEFGNRVTLAPEGCNMTGISWLVRLSNEGKFINFIPTFQSSEGKSKPKANQYLLPYIEKTSGVKANLLVGNLEYVLGVPRAKELEKKKKGGKDKEFLSKVKSRHEAFIAEIDDCLKSISDTKLIAVKNFLISDKESAVNQLPDKLSDEDNLTFDVEGEIIGGKSTIHSYWAQKQSKELEDESDDESEDSDDESPTVIPTTCFICNETKTIPEIHAKIKPVPAGQTGGVSIISGNKRAFESYGLKRAHIAPLCRDCSDIIHKATNWLIRSSENSFLLPKKVVYLFWTREQTSFSVSNLFNDPQADEIKKLFESPYKGKKGLAVAPNVNQFYCLALSGSGGRAVVRDWIEASLDTVQDNLRHYFEGQLIEGGRFPYQKLITLAGGTVRELDDLAPWIPMALIEYALKGLPLPISLLTTAVRRCAIGKKVLGGGDRKHVDNAQAALVKLCLYSLYTQQNQPISEDWMVKLDSNCDTPAYLYGRLFNTLEQIQQDASGVNNVERTFGTAVMSPVSTLPRLIARAKQAHLPKLRRDNYPAFARYEKQLNEIHAKLGTTHAFLNQLNAENQGFFVLGYYHQNAAKWEAIAEAAQRKADKETIENKL